MLKSIFYHSCDTLKVPEVALQACVNEDQEQRRRLLDKDGEAQKKFVANKTAQLFKFTPYQLRHVPYPLSASLFVRKAAPGVIEEGVHAAEDAIHNLSVAAEGAWHSAAEAMIAFGHKAADFAAVVTEKTAEAASMVGEKTVEAANVVGDKTVQAYDMTLEAASTLGEKTAEAATLVGEKTAEARVYAKDTAVLIKHKTYDAALYFGHKTADIASVVAPLAADIASEAKSRIVQLSDEIMYSTTKAYAHALMEFERRRRMVDFEEQYAILNAVAVSGLIRGIGYEFYRQSNCTFTYSYILLEELERKWRQVPTHSTIAFANAKKTSLLVKGKFIPLSQGTLLKQLNIVVPPISVPAATKLEEEALRKANAFAVQTQQPAYSPAL